MKIENQIIINDKIKLIKIEQDFDKEILKENLNKLKDKEIEEKVAHLICKAAEKYKVPLEINLNNIFGKTYYENRKLNHKPIDEQRKNLEKVVYPCKKFWEIASEYDINVLYGIDAHHRGQILLFKELVELANEIIGKDVIEKFELFEK